jgi:hypothetical protein
MIMLGIGLIICAAMFIGMFVVGGPHHMADMNREVSPKIVQSDHSHGQDRGRQKQNIHGEALRMKKEWNLRSARQRNGMGNITGRRSHDDAGGMVTVELAQNSEIMSCSATSVRVDHE